MKRQVIAINPHLVVNAKDILTTGIVYMPTLLAYFVSYIERMGVHIDILDVFGLAPENVWREGDFLIRGLSYDQISKVAEQKHSVVVFFANSLINHHSLERIIEIFKEKNPEVKMVVLENSQAVTAYSLKAVHEKFERLGVNCLVTGDSDQKGAETVAHLLGVPFDRTDFSNEVYPAWDSFPLNNYWSLKYGHGPVGSKKYLPLITSRGCPFSCGFCVSPETSGRTWRSRTPQSVVSEMEHWNRHLGVTEFHWEDLNPTVDEGRIRQICEMILSKNLRVTWKLVSGTKIETIKQHDTISLMARAGCNYISISPESGSNTVLAKMKKKFDLSHAISALSQMRRNGIYSQACFVLGYPGETKQDIGMTLSLVRQFTLKGIDEIAVFIVTPVPGSAIYSQFKQVDDFSVLNFSPVWRDDYAVLDQARKKAYRIFLFTKLLRFPLRVAAQCCRFAIRRFSTKMEMVPYRALHTRYLIAKRFVSVGKV